MRPPTGGLLLCCLLSVPSAWAQAPASPAPTPSPNVHAPGGPTVPAALPQAKLEAIERLVASEMSLRGIPGLSLALAADGDLRFTSGYGLADVENGVPAKASTVYRLGSISKTITATAVMQLVERGNLDLDAPVQRYVATYPEKPWPLTPHHLLAHLGGIRNYSEGEFGSTRRYTSLTEALAIFKDDPLVHEPGTKFLYTTYGYNLLGSVVEGASGLAFMAYLEENILRPAGMESTKADDVLVIISNRARGYQRGPSGELLNSALADTSNKVPGGGLAGTAEDVARFAVALQGGVLVRRETAARMFSRQAARDGKLSGYGLGVFLADRRGIREVWHTGGQQRVSTVLYMQPGRRLAVAILANLEGVRDPLLDLARQIADVVSAR